MQTRGNSIIESRREIPVKDNVDVLVVGGGSAGVTAAIAAARCGAKTLVIERYGFLGGLVPGGLSNYSRPPGNLQENSRC